MDNYIKTYESFVQDVIRSHNKKRLNNDNNFIELFNEIVEDFEKYDKDLRKVSIIDSKEKTIGLDKIRVGNDYTLTYNFGKFHTINNNPTTGNKQHGAKSVKINSVPFIFTLNKNELERTFNVPRIRLRNADVTIETIDRLDGRVNSNYDNYKISYDVADNVFEYFIDEYKEQYPQAVKSRYKKAEIINNIERGDSFIVKYINVNNKDGDKLRWGLHSNENEKEMRKKLYNMTEEEVTKMYKERQSIMRGKHEKRHNKKKEKYTKIFSELLEKYGIEYDDMRITFFGEDIRLELKTSDKKIEEKTKELFDQSIDGFIITDTRIQNSHDNQYMFVTIIYEKNS